jgi:glyoxylase-like metal-dependent hydrolase (beta-lactamase superfamily II)
LLSLGPWRFAVRHVPGHSPGHVAFVGHGLCLSGDVLFQGSIGRSDLPGGDHDQLLRSIHDELLVLPDDTRVLPGHGPETTIGRERAGNPFLVRDA